MRPNFRVLAVAALVAGLAACATPCPPAPETQAETEAATTAEVARCPFERPTNAAFAG